MNIPNRLVMRGYWNLFILRQSVKSALRRRYQENFGFNGGENALFCKKMKKNLQGSQKKRTFAPEK